MKWCNTHQRPADLCQFRGGILLPCRVIDTKEIMIEIDSDYIASFYLGKEEDDNESLL